MLTLEERNRPAIAKICEVIDDAYTNVDGSMPSREMVKEAITEANDDTGNFSGERSIAWKSGSSEHTVTWILHQGRIVEVILQSVKNGAVRILRKRKLLVHT